MQPRHTHNSKLSLRPATTTLHPRPKPPQQRTDCFQGYFQDLMNRKSNPFSTIDSPQLAQQLSQLPVPPDNYVCCMSTPPARLQRTHERKKYQQIKERIEEAMRVFGTSEMKSLQELFSYRQTVLSQFLNEFTEEIEKECREKGEILKYIWNSMFGMLEQIGEKLAGVVRAAEKSEVENSLRSHQTYQEMIENYRKKQMTLSEKSKLERMTINSLVFELRFKRKEINKLYRNQKLLVNKLNQLKNDNLNLQGSYVDLMSSVRDLPPENVAMLLKAREEINNSKHIKLNIRGNRRHNRCDITQELKNEREDDLDDLYEELKEIATNQLHEPHLVSTLIEAAIQNFGIKNDDPLPPDRTIVSVPNALPTVNAETQIDEMEFKYPGRADYIIQMGYVERLSADMINSKATQTYCQFGRKKIIIDQSTELDTSFFRKKYVEKKFYLSRAYEDTFCYRPDPVIKINNISFERYHKKHFSDINILDRKGQQGLMELNSQDFINEDMESLQRDSIIDSDEEEVDGKIEINGLRFSKTGKRNTNTSSINLYGKNRYGSIKSNQYPKPEKDIPIINSDQFYKKSSFAPKDNLTPPSQPSKILKTQTRSTRVSKDKTIKAMKSSISSTTKLSKIREEAYNKNFLQKNNYFNIEMDQEKENYIQNIFVRKEYPQFYMDLEEAGEANQVDQETDNQQFSEDTQGITQQFLEAIPKRSMNRKGTVSSVGKSSHDRRNSTQKYTDENDMLLNMCRSNYNKKSKKFKERVSIFKYRDQFTSVKDNIELVAKDVKELIMHKQAMLKKAINSKNLKNTYKILMMTFSKAYDCYNKGIIISNLVYPLFQSFAVVYGAINNTEIYKKMINFIACLSVNTDNTILKFFLFFLGLDSKSPYSEKVTISQVYLCLKLLQKISSEGKVTLNIESIYTDTTKIKKQLINILKEEKIPEELSLNVEKRVVDELQNSCLFKNSSEEDSHLKINIYNIILLIIQEVIKCKNNLRESFIPILQLYQQFQDHRKLPISILQIVLSMWKTANFQKDKLHLLILTLRKNSKTETVTIEQFCSILFECNLIHLDQLYIRSRLANRKGWKPPLDYYQEIHKKAKFRKFEYPLEKEEIDLVMRLAKSGTLASSQHGSGLEKMKRLIFQKHYERKVQLVARKLMGEDLSLLPDLQ